VDHGRFDAISRAAARGTNRRTVLKGLMGALGGSVLGGALGLSNRYGPTASAQDAPLAATQELTAGISRNLVNGPEDFWDVHASLQVWEPLLRYNDTFELVPALAESWTLSEDGLTWTFKLRQDVHFSNGNPFNAAGVVANINRGKILSGKASNFLGGINFPEIYGEPTRIEAIDDYTVELEYASPLPLLPYSISNHYSAQFDPASFDPNTAFFLDKPIGTGRFTLGDWQRDQYVVLERNQQYWGPEPATLDKVTLKLYTDPNARVSALKSGEVDALVELGALLPAQADELSREDGYTVAAHASACQTYLTLNQTKGPFNDVKVRQALSLAINRDELVDQLLYGYVAPAKQIFTQFNTAWTLLDDPSIQVKYDADQAKTLLDEATGGSGVNVSLLFSPPAEGISQWPYPLIAQYLQAVLQPIGFNIELKQVEAAAATDLRNNGDFDFAFSNNCWATGDPNYQIGRVVSSTNALNTTQHNGYNNPQVDELLAQARVEIDHEKQKDLYNQIQVIANNEVVIVPLYDQQTITAAKSYVSGLSQHIAYAPTLDTVKILEH
jgi:peptide/nickel transport system substrate-binding protein